MTSSWPKSKQFFPLMPNINHHIYAKGLDRRYAPHGFELRQMY
jgi:hypothetical protein